MAASLIRDSRASLLQANITLQTLNYDAEFAMDPSKDRVNILLVDDRSEQLLVLESILGSLNQNIVRAHSGRDALRFLLANDCAVILLDVNMPDMDGFETASLIRQRPRTHQTPIIFVTAYDETETHVSRGYSLGAVDYIHTPVLPEVLVAKVSVFVELAKQTETVRRQAEQLEARVLERTAELRAANDALQAEIAERERTEADRARLLHEAQDGVRRRDEFVAMLAHELRNPLAPILNSAELMNLIGLPDPGLEAARDVIERQACHMARLLDDLLDIARFVHGKIELSRQLVDMKRLITEAADTKRSQMAKRQHVLSVVLPDESMLVHGDPTRLLQILSNLLTNATKYTNPGGRIMIRAEREQSNVVIRVRDTGIGIPDDMLTRVFEPFVQLDTPHLKPSGGLGVGLTLVRRLVELHGGTVIATSAGLDRGSEFVVTLPGASPAELLDFTPAANPESCGDGLRTAAPTGRRVVLVEDNDDVREMLRLLLDLDGHEVEVSANGCCGVETIRRIRPDLALVVVGLPGLDGYQVAEQVRADPSCRAVRLVAMTGYGQPEDHRRALAAGFDAHLVKPVRAEEISRLLAQ